MDQNKRKHLEIEALKLDQNIKFCVMHQVIDLEEARSLWTEICENFQKLDMGILDIDQVSIQLMTIDAELSQKHEEFHALVEAVHASNWRRIGQTHLN